jgi:NADH dehydrogenase
LPGDLADVGAIESLVDACDALIYNIGILRASPSRGITFEALHFQGAKRAIDLAVAAGGRRFLLMSANGARAEGTAYQRTKFQAEEYLRTAGLDYGIFRPSVIFGPPRGRMEIATQLYQDVIRPPFPAPLFYAGILPVDAGGFRLSPVHVEEVATAFADALDADEAGGKTSLLCGPEALTWREILKRVAGAGGYPYKTMIPVPAYPLRFGASLLDQFDAFPITADQLRMLLEGNTCEPAAAADVEIIIGTRRFDEDELSYLTSSTH